MRSTPIVLAAVAALVAACSHEEKTAVVSTTGAPIVVGGDAVRRLTDAHCAHAKACYQIGENAGYADDDACQREVHSAMNSDLISGECPGGIREAKLSACIENIRTERCRDPLDKIVRPQGCRTRSLCID